MKNRNEIHTQDNQIPHWYILIAGILIALFVWLWWLTCGMEWAHLKTVRQVAPIVKSLSIDSSIIVQKNTTASDLGISPTAPDREHLFAELGQTGDSFGGLNALLTALAGALVGWAGFMQHQTLKQAREEAKMERVYRQRQEFEAHFFQLLQLSSSITDKINRENKKLSTSPLIGSSALDSYASSIFKKIPEVRKNQLNSEVLSTLVETFFVDVYDRKPSAFGPYFRLLYQTFKHIAESDLSDEEQVRYSNIARGQISEGAVLLLALNGLTQVGYKFVPIIEKFGLLEHLHRRYRAAYEQVLLIGYRSRAFMGSEQRSHPENAWIIKPKLEEMHFAALEKKRIDGDTSIDFELGYDSQEPHDE